MAWTTTLRSLLFILRRPEGPKRETPLAPHGVRGEPMKLISCRCQRCGLPLANGPVCLYRLGDELDIRRHATRQHSEQCEGASVMQNSAHADRVFPTMVHSRNDKVLQLFGRSHGHDCPTAPACSPEVGSVGSSAVGNPALLAQAPSNV
jgi:hypothetical protein